MSIERESTVEIIVEAAERLMPVYIGSRGYEKGQSYLNGFDKGWVKGYMEALRALDLYSDEVHEELRERVRELQKKTGVCVFVDDENDILREALAKL